LDNRLSGDLANALLDGADGPASSTSSWKVDTRNKAFVKRTRELYSKRTRDLEAAKLDVGFMPFDSDVDEFIAQLCYWTWPLHAVRRLRLGTEELVCRHRDVKEAVEPLAQGVSPRAAKALRDFGCAVAWAFKKERVTRDLICPIAEP